VCGGQQTSHGWGQRKHPRPSHKLETMETMCSRGPFPQVPNCARTQLPGALRNIVIIVIGAVRIVTGCDFPARMQHGQAQTHLGSAAHNQAQTSEQGSSVQGVRELVGCRAREIERDAGWACVVVVRTRQGPQMYSEAPPRRIHCCDGPARHGWRAQPA
jgi:hypothetical protein